MGAENSVLEGCTWGPQIDCPPKFPWEVSPVTRPDGSSATVFEAKTPKSKDEELLKKSAVILRTLRHPNVIRFIGCGESSSGFSLVSESVTPLFSVVTDLTSHEICAGLFDILLGLDFLHSKLKVCHNNICVSSVYISSDGTWKLAGFEHACKFEEATPELLERTRAFRQEDSLSPEEKAATVASSAASAHARDVFAFGVLVDTILDSLREKDACAQLLEKQMSVCLDPDPAHRPSVAELLTLSVFRTDIIEILTFLKNITVKTDIDKKEFFSNLLSRLHQLPEVAVARRLVVPLMARFVLLENWAVSHVLPHLLTPKDFGSAKSSTAIQGLLSEHYFRQYVINHIYNIFHVYDSHVRLVLLEHFASYVNMFSRQQLEDDIFIQILLGVRDSDDRLIAASLRALADLVPILGGDLVVGGSRKSFFFHGLPKTIGNNRLPSTQNVMSVLTEQKLFQHDQFKTSNGGTSSEKWSAEKDKKNRERELRREAARLKRKERKLSVKDLQADTALGSGTGAIEERTFSTSSVNDENESLNLIIEQVGQLTNEEKAPHEIDIDENSLSKQVYPDDDSEAPDWSDWEDTDQKISDEIEAELQTMSNVLNSQSKLQTSPHPHKGHSSLPPSLNEDWSYLQNAGFSQVSEGSRQPTTNNSNHLQFTNLGGMFLYDVNFGPEEEARNGKLANVTSSKSRTDIRSSDGNKRAVNGSKPLTQKTTSINDDLGAGLDIKSINIVKKYISSELDFFADMTPTIAESQQKDFISLLEAKTTEKKDNQEPDKPAPLPSTKSNLFAVTSIADEEAVGWSEDASIDLENEFSNS